LDSLLEWPLRLEILGCAIKEVLKRLLDDPSGASGIPPGEFRVKVVRDGYSDERVNG
jgi:hypothetical protein